MRVVREHPEDYLTFTAVSARVVRQEGVAQEFVRRWQAKAEVDDGSRPSVTREESAEAKILKAENRWSREDIEILSGASILFAGELNP